MFTGLVEDVGTIVGTQPQGAGRLLEIRTAIDLTGVALGDSIAVDGACLTVDSKGTDAFRAVAGAETVARTTLGDARPGRRVHLERALRVGDRLGGHLVQGHVDGLGRLIRREDRRETVVLWIEVPRDLSRYVAAKGSLCIDGVSLTVNEVTPGSPCKVRVNVVPHTARVTRLGGLSSGQAVNLEVDILAKYVERMLDAGKESGLTLQMLRHSGFSR